MDINKYSYTHKLWVVEQVSYWAL